MRAPGLPLPARGAASSACRWGDPRLRAVAGAAAGLAASVLGGRQHQGYSVGLSSCAAAPAAALGSASLAIVDKPETHRHRAYEYFRLPNGLQVVIASDAACDKAAAALCVGVGRLHEPKEVPGLAHFCEHMLFLGTEGFPDEAEYKRFLKGHGGYCNAATGDSFTCYVFDVAPDFLSGALDRFSQFFLAPLFTPSATERELNAVDSEHSMRVTDDGRRAYATLLLDANPEHPLHWGSGNLRSLRDEPRARGLDPHTEVVNFYREHYTSEDMTLAVVGRQSLPELRHMIEARFAGVRATGRRAVHGDEVGAGRPAIRPEDFRGLVLRVPSKDLRSVAFGWQLPNYQVPRWQTKPGAYASHLVGNEGEGSLLSALKARGYATALSAGVDDFGCFSQFEVTITLTEQGLDHIQEVGELVFACLRLVRATPVQSWVLHEIQKLREVRFRFADDMQPYNLVNTIARNLQNYPPADVLSAPYKLPSPDEGASAEILRHLTLDGLRVELVGKRFETRCTAQDPWYGGRYLKAPLEDSWREAWAKAAGPLSLSAAAADLAAAEAEAARFGLRLPRPNPFVPEDLTWRAPPAGGAGAVPRLLEGVNVPGVAKLFHRQDDRFAQPKAAVAFRLHSPSSSQDAVGHLRARVWCSSIMEELNEYAYNAQSAGLAYDLGSVNGGLELSVSGFSDKLPVLLGVVARKMRETDTVSPGTFEIVRDRYERGLRNRAFKQRPIDYAARKARELKHSLAFPAEDQLEALQSLKPSDLDGESARILGECHIEALLTGNLTPEEAAATAAAAAGELLRRPPAPSAPAFRAEAALPAGYTVWRLDGTNPEERNNSVRLEIQLPIGMDCSVQTSLLARIVSPKFSDDLRTKQQLGYIVQMSWTEHEGFISIICQVQTEYPPEYVRGQIDTFLDETFGWVESGLDEAEFARQRAGVVSNLAEAPKNLGEEFSRYWGEIARQRYDFERRDRKRRAVEAADLASLRAFVRDQVRGAPRLYVEVHNISAGPGKQPPEGSAPAREPDRVWRGDADARLFRAGARWVALNEGESGAAPERAAPAARL